MDKLTIATQVLLKLIETDKTGFDAEGIAAYSFEIADAMQTEADKRKPSGLPDALKEEWQPDWSQAPKNMNYFFMNKDGSKYWTVNKPDKPNLSEHVMDCLECGGDYYAYASSQDYQGNWKNSLRERPHVF